MEELQSLMGYSHCDPIAFKHMYYLLDQCRIKLCSTSFALLPFNN